MLFIRVGGISLLLAWVVVAALGLVVWSIVVMASFIVLVGCFARPSVRREFGKGWRGEPPYDS